VAVYLIFFKDNLVRPMVTGRRASEDFGDVSLSDAKLSWLRLAIAVAVALAAMWGISNAG
jgi:cytochrome b